MLIASLSLVAFPFMTGFYSKDFILESAYGQYYFSSTVVYIIATIGAMFTTLYSVKVLYLTFLTNPNGPLINYKQAHEGDIFMSLPLMILAVFSIFFGFITKDMFIGLGSGFFSDNALFIHPSHEIMLDTEFGVPTLFKLLPLVFTISLSVISIVLSEYLSTILIYFKLSRVGYNIFSFFNQRFLVELFYNRYITGIILKLGGQTTKVIDKGSVEYLGPYGLEKGLLNISNNIARLNTGVITSYALYVLTGLILYLLFNAYLHSSIIILVLVISLSLVLFQSRKPINPTGVSRQTLFNNGDLSTSHVFLGLSRFSVLKSSSLLEDMVTQMDKYIDGLKKDIGTGRSLSKLCKETNSTPLEISQQKTTVVKQLKQQIESQAAKELADPNITAETESAVRNVLNETNILHENSTQLILEAIQAVADAGVAG